VRCPGGRPPCRTWITRRRGGRSIWRGSQDLVHPLGRRPHDEPAAEGRDGPVGLDQRPDRRDDLLGQAGLQLDHLGVDLRRTGGRQRGGHRAGSRRRIVITPRAGRSVNGAHSRRCRNSIDGSDWSQRSVNRWASTTASRRDSTGACSSSPGVAGRKIDALVDHDDVVTEARVLALLGRRDVHCRAAGQALQEVDQATPFHTNPALVLQQDAQVALRTAEQELPHGLQDRLGRVDAAIEVPGVQADVPPRRIEEAGELLGGPAEEVAGRAHHRFVGHARSSSRYRIDRWAMPASVNTGPSAPNPARS